MKLTPEQRRAVETKERIALVIAGAGTGKTQVLTERARHLLTTAGASASELCVVTFTRRAAGAMTERLRRLMRDHHSEPAEGSVPPSENARQHVDRLLSPLTIGTFHSIALRIVRAEADKIGYARNLTIIDEEDAEWLLTECARELGYYVEKKWKNNLSMAKLQRLRQLLYSTGVLCNHSTQQQEVGRLGEILLEYQNRLKRLNCLDFGLLQLALLTLLTKHPDVLLRYQKKIRHLLVDEIQDCDVVQWKIVHLLGVENPGCTVFLVGDMRQSIYGFRGARPDLVPDQFAGEVYDLTQTFRFGEPIAAVANSLISHNSDPGQALVGTDRDSFVQLFHGRSADTARRIQGILGVGYAPEDIAVLCRTNRTAQRVGAILGELEVPYRIAGDTFRLASTPEFKVVLGAMRLAVNPRDDLAFLKVWPALGYTVKDLAEVRGIAAKHSLSLRAAFDTFVLDRAIFLPLALSSSYADNVGKFTFGVCNFLEYAFPNKRRRIAPWGFFEEHCGGMTVQNALAWYAMRDAQDDVGDYDVVTVCTVHTAKGLEWPVVLVVDLNEGNFPIQQAITANQLPEERRLCYVAVTRAQEVLGLHYRSPQDQAQDRKIKPPSRFLVQAGMLEQGVGGGQSDEAADQPSRDTSGSPPLDGAASGPSSAPLTTE